MALPKELAVISPVSDTLTIFSFEVFQIIFGSFRVLGNISIFKFLISFSFIKILSGRILISLISSFFETFTFILEYILPSGVFIVISAIPSFNPFIFPSADTETILLSLLTKITFLSVALVGKILYSTVLVSSIFNVISFGKY